MTLAAVEEDVAEVCCLLWQKLWCHTGSPAVFLVTSWKGAKKNRYREDREFPAMLAALWGTYPKCQCGVSHSSKLSWDVSARLKGKATKKQKQKENWEQLPACLDSNITNQLSFSFSDPHREKVTPLMRRWIARFCAVGSKTLWFLLSSWCPSHKVTTNHMRCMDTHLFAVSHTVGPSSGGTGCGRCSL